MSYEKVNAKRIGKALRAIRKARGLSQDELALKCDTYKAYISNLERGVWNPTLNSLSSVLGALNLTLEELFDKTKHL